MDPEELDLSAQYASGPAAEPPGIPFTQADSLRLQKLQAGLSQAQEDFDSGEILPETHAEMTGLIAQQMAPLAQRQKQSQQQQQQDAFAQAQQQRAMGAALEHSDAIFRAQGVQDRIGLYTDPLTGQTAHLIEDGPNRWREIEFGNGQTASPSELMAYDPTAQGESGGRQWESEAELGRVGKSLGYTRSGQDAPLPGTDPYHVPGQDAPLPAGESGDSPEAAPGSPAVAPTADGGHVMTIYNGANAEQYYFGPDGTTRQLPGPQQQQDQQQGMALSPTELAVLRDRARKAVPHPQLTGNPRLDAPKMLQYQKAVDNLTSHMAGTVMKGRSNQQQQQSIAARQDKTQQAAKDLETQKEEARKQHELRTKQQAETDQQLLKQRQDHVDRMMKEREAHLKRQDQRAKDGQAAEAMPEHLNSMDAMEAEAERRVERAHQFLQRMRGGAPQAAPEKKKGPVDLSSLFPQP